MSGSMLVLYWEVLTLFWQGKEDTLEAMYVRNSLLVSIITALDYHTLSHVIVAYDIERNTFSVEFKKCNLLSARPFFYLLYYEQDM